MWKCDFCSKEGDLLDLMGNGLLLAMEFEDAQPYICTLCLILCSKEW